MICVCSRRLILVSFIPLVYAVWLSAKGEFRASFWQSHPYGSRPASPHCSTDRPIATVRSSQTAFLGSCNAISYHPTWQGAEQNLPDLVEQLSRLKNERPKDQNEHRLQQQKIQNLSFAIMQLVQDSKDDQYLRAEQEWLLSTALLLISHELNDQLPPKFDVAHADNVLSRWSNYVERREVVDISDLRLMAKIGKSFEASGNREMAIKCYKLFVSKLRGKVADSTDVGVRVKGGLEGSFDQLVAIFEGTIRRLQLIGNKMELEGQTFQGHSFQLSEYEGRVVLVDYWATWCGPCIAEYPQIRKLYEKYHSRGFEVVGVSMDADREGLATYLREKEVPWLVLHDAETAGKHPSTEYYSIQTVPAMFLVGRDGKVISTSVEVGKLDAILEDMLK